MKVKEISSEIIGVILMLLVVLILSPLLVIGYVSDRMEEQALRDSYDN